MSAVACGKRMYVEELHPGSPPHNAMNVKRMRCSGGTFSPTRTAQENHTETMGDRISQQLRSLFPRLQAELVDKVLGDCGYNFEQAFKNLSELCTSEDQSVSNTCTVADSTAIPEAAENSNIGNVEDSCVDSRHPSASVQERVEWVDLLVREMSSATDLCDARMRGVKFLEFFENNYLDKTKAFADSLQKENAELKGQVQGLLKDSHILKRAVAIQHERQLEHERRSEEWHQLSLLLPQYQDKIKALEMNNYALSLQLRTSCEVSSIPGRFHPDVF